MEVRVFSRAPKRGRLAQLARAPRLHRGSRGFESLTAHQFCEYFFGYVFLGDIMDIEISIRGVIFLKRLFS